MGALLVTGEVCGVYLTGEHDAARRHRAETLPLPPPVWKTTSLYSPLPARRRPGNSRGSTAGGGQSAATTSGTVAGSVSGPFWDRWTSLFRTFRSPPRTEPRHENHVAHRNPPEHDPTPSKSKKSIVLDAHPSKSSRTAHDGRRSACRTGEKGINMRVGWQLPGRVCQLDSWRGPWRGVGSSEP
jgi:hypothetical protein